MLSSKFNSLLLWWTSNNNSTLNLYNLCSKLRVSSNRLFQEQISSPNPLRFRKSRRQSQSNRFRECPSKFLLVTWIQMKCSTNRSWTIWWAKCSIFKTLCNNLWWLNRCKANLNTVLIWSFKWWLRCSSKFYSFNSSRICNRNHGQ